MKKNLKKWALLLMTAIALPATTMAQDKVEFSASMPLVSQYIWRGQDLGGVSLQAEFGLSYKGFSLMAFASSGFEKNDPEEFDLTLGYETGNFSISLTDFWCLPDDEEFDYFKYGAHSTSHVFEAQVGYDFRLVALKWKESLLIVRIGNRSIQSLELGLGSRSRCNTMGYRLLCMC